MSLLALTVSNPASRKPREAGHPRFVQCERKPSFDLTVGGDLGHSTDGSNGSVWSFAYDHMGRLSQSTVDYGFDSAGAYTVQYGYDAASNRTGMTAPDGSTNTHVYDNLNRLSTLTNSLTGQFGFSYDALSRRTQLTRPNGVNTSYTYDNLSRLLSVLHQTGGTTLDGAAYTYDLAGNRTSKTNYLNSVTENYNYDAIYQLTQVQQGGTTTESYSYDAVGNRLSSLGMSPYAYNSSNELTSTPAATYTYDHNGNTLSKTDISGTTRYSWNYYTNRLDQVTLPGGAGTVTFKYDPFGRRIQKSGPLGTTNYLYDGTNLLEEVDNAGNLLARYTQGTNVDEPLAEFRPATSYYESDGLGSVTSLSGSSGTIVTTYSYDTFGQLISSTGTVLNPFQYTARDFDAETALRFYRARYYDPDSGRFLSEDPIRFKDGVNFYSYVKNSPVSKFDPTGLARCDYYIQNGSGHQGWLYCLPDDPRNTPVSFEAASGNNGDPQHHCKNNAECAPIGDTGPIPPGNYHFTGTPGDHHKNGTVLQPDDPAAAFQRGGPNSPFETHWCLNPFTNSRPYCSGGCITATQDNINRLNDLLTLEPGSTLTVYPGPPQI